MERRRFIGAVGSVLASAAAGCSARERGATGTESVGRTATAEPTAVESEPTPDPDDPIAIVLSEDLPAGPVSVTVTRREEIIFEESVTREGNDRTEIDPGIDDVGQYELSVELADGQRRSRTWTVGGYDVRMGSNVIVTLLDDDVLFLVEE